MHVTHIIKELHSSVMFNIISIKISTKQNVSTISSDLGIEERKVVPHKPKRVECLQQEEGLKPQSHLWQLLSFSPQLTA